MVNKYEIVTAHGILDTDGESNITITKKILDILDISKRETSISQSIELPSTPFNNQFFKNIYNVNIDSLTFNPARSIPATIKVGTNEVLKGNLQLLEIRRDNEEITYEISIAGELSNLYQAFGDFTLANLDMSEYNHIRNQENIVNSWDYKIYRNGSLLDIGEPGTGYVYGYHINGNNTGIYNQFFVQDATPWPYVKTVVDKMFQFTGYKYKSNFFESDYFKKLVFNYVGDRLQLTEEQVARRIVAAGVNPATPYAAITQPTYGNEWQYNDNYIFPNSYYLGLPRESGTVDDTTGELQFRDDLGQFDGNQFTVQNAGRYNITFNANVVAAVGRDGGGHVQYNGGSSFEYIYQMILFKANGTVTTLWNSNTMNWTPDEDDHAENPYFYNDAIPTITMQVDNLFMEVGDRIAVRLGFRFPEGTNWQGNDSDYNVQMYFKDVRDGGFTFFRAKSSNSEDYGDTEIDMNQILNSSYKMTDVWNDLVNMFNLVVMDDDQEDNTLIIEPADDFFSSSQKVLNWDGDEDNERKLDLDSPIKIKPISELDAKIYRYTYAEDDDFLNKEYKRETGKVYGEYEIEVINDFSDKINTTKLSLCPTPVGSQFIDSRIAPLFVNYEDETFTPKKPKQRMLFYGGREDMYEGSVMWIRNYAGQPDVDSTPVTSYGYVGMWETPRNAVNSLEFGRPSKIYYDAFDTYPNQTLFEKFHKATLNNIIDINARLLECTVKLTPKDIATFDFRNIIFLLGSYWRVNTIVDYNPVSSDCLTKVILYKIIDLDIIDRYQVKIPTSNRTCPIDMISKKTRRGIITVSASGQEVTEDCCNSLGGTYLGGVCYLKTIKPVGTLPAVGINTDFGGPVKPIISGGLNIVPVKAESGPIILNKDNTTRGSLGVKTIGYGNYVAQGVNNSIIIGNNNSILSGSSNNLIVGDNISATGNSTVYTTNIELSSGGTINSIPINTITQTLSGGPYLPLTGGTLTGNLVMNTGTTISSNNGGGKIELDVFSTANFVGISTDNGNYLESYLALTPTTAALYSLGGAAYLQFIGDDFGLKTSGGTGIQVTSDNLYLSSNGVNNLSGTDIIIGGTNRINLYSPFTGGTPIATLMIDSTGDIVTGTTSGGAYLPLSGGTMVGNIIMDTGTVIKSNDNTTILTVDSNLGLLNLDDGAGTNALVGLQPTLAALALNTPTTSGSYSINTAGLVMNAFGSGYDYLANLDSNGFTVVENIGGDTPLRVDSNGVSIELGLNLGFVPATVNTNTKLVTRNATTGDIELRDVSSLPAGSLSTRLTAWDAFSATTGFVSQTGSNTWVSRTITGPAAGITISNGNGIAGNPTLALANDLSALEGLSSTGFAVRTGTDTWAQRTITAGSCIGVTNGNGVSGNPTIALTGGTMSGSLTVTGNLTTNANLVADDFEQVSASQVQTTNATITTIKTIPIATEYVYQIEANICGGINDTSKGITSKILGSFKNNGGTVTQIGKQNIIMNRDFTSADVTMVISGTNVLVRVTGESLTKIDWGCSIIIHRMAMGVI